jgi:putative SOS response-associated peptidase YedK
MRDTTGNLPSLPAAFPDSMAPVVRNAPVGTRELPMARWAMPAPLAFGDTHVTNVCNTNKPYWQRWLRPENRCIVPWTSFCDADSKPKKTPTWFAFDETRPLAVFAGIWTTWHGTRGPKANPVEGEHQLFGFLTTEANDVVGAIHPKAMPVILTMPAEIETWMTAPAEEALKLQRPFQMARWKSWHGVSAKTRPRCRRDRQLVNLRTCTIFDRTFTAIRRYSLPLADNRKDVLCIASQQRCGILASCVRVGIALARL